MGLDAESIKRAIESKRAAAGSETGQDVGRFFQDPALRNFMNSSRQCNTIPKKVALTVRFVEDWPRMDEYNFTDEGGNDKPRPSALIKAIISYEKEASHLVMDEPFLLALSPNSVRGLENEMRRKRGSGTLNGKKFKVYTRNCKTYEWTLLE